MWWRYHEDSLQQEMDVSSLNQLHYILWRGRPNPAFRYVGLTPNSWLADLKPTLLFLAKSGHFYRRCLSLVAVREPTSLA